MVGELVSFELRDQAFYLRVMAESQWQEIEKNAIDELPSDLKAKQLFRVTKVTAEFVVIEKGDTSISIPVSRIIYLQRGPAEFIK